jgi:hypothetical protein
MVNVVRARREMKQTHPTILSQVLLTYFFCSTPSLTAFTTAFNPLSNSPTYKLSPLTYSASLHGLLPIAANAGSIVSSNSRRMARREEEMVLVKRSFSSERETREESVGSITSRRRSSSCGRGRKGEGQ